MRLFLLLTGFLFCFAFPAIAQTEPASQPTNMTVSSNKAYEILLTFTPSTANGFITVRSLSPITWTPVDGTVYQKGQGVAAGVKVLKISSVPSIIVTDVQQNTTYYFATFAYNTSGGNYNYKSDNPLRDTVISALANPGSYYNSINPAATTFVSDLTNLINSHTLITYASFKDNIMPAIYERDTTGSQVAVNCEYTTELYVYTPSISFGSGTNQYSKEHRFPQSYFPTGASTTTAEGADFHNLALTNYNKANAKRSNNPYGEVVNPTYTYFQGTLGKDAANKTVYEPRESFKGDCARAFLYMMVCYNGTGGFNWGGVNLPSEGPNQDLELLKTWSRNDPPDNWEKTKNQYIFTLQNNRNPFIDHPEWVDCINFSNITKATPCNTIGIVNQIGSEISEVLVFPNPSNSYFTLQFSSDITSDAELQLSDVSGRNVIVQQLQIVPGTNEHVVSVSNLSAGNYLLTLDIHGKKLHKSISVGIQ